MLNILIEHRAAPVDREIPEVSLDALCPGCQEENVCPDRFHQDPIVNQLFAWAAGCRCAVLRWDPGSKRRNRESAARLPIEHELLAGVRPAMTIELREGHPAPVEVISAKIVAFDLHMHHHRIRLLNLSNLAQLHAVAETGGKVA